MKSVHIGSIFVFYIPYNNQATFNKVNAAITQIRHSTVSTHAQQSDTSIHQFYSNKNKM